MSSAVFPTLAGRGWDLIQTPIFKTHIQRAVAGREARTSYMSYPLYEMTLTYDVLRANTLAELQAILDFFLARHGAYDNFLFLNWWDNQTPGLPDGTEFGIGTGSRTQYQLLRSVKAGGFLEPVMNLVTPPSVYIDHVGQSIGSQYTLSSGMVTFASPPAEGAVLTWIGSYYYRCRFKQDIQELKNFSHQLWDLKKCELVGCLGNKI